MASNEKREYYEQFIGANTKKVHRLIAEAPQKQLEYLSELFINHKSIIQSKQEEKKVRRYMKVIQRFLKRKWSTKQIKAFFIKHSKLLLILIITFLSKVMEGFICNVFSNGDL